MRILLFETLSHLAKWSTIFSRASFSEINFMFD
jgi:hypothetical protein